MNITVYMLSCCQALLTTGNILLVSVVALIGQSLTTNPSMSTFPVATQFVGLMMATIPASLIMKRVGRKNGFYLGNSVGITGAALCLFALYQHQFWLFSVGTLLLGIGIGFGTLYRFAAVEICEPEQAARAISFVMAGGVIAALVGPKLAIYSQSLISDIEFAGAFLGLLLLYTLALCILFFADIPREDLSSTEGEQRPLKEIMAQPAFITAVVVGMVGYAVMNLLMTATPLAMARCGFDFPQTAHVIEWHVLGMFVPSFFTGRLITRFGLKTIMYTGGLFMLGCVVVNLLGVTEWHFWLALLFLGIGWNFMFIPATQLVTRSYSSSEKSKTQAANEFLVFGMVTLSAFSSGWLEASFGWIFMNWAMLPIIFAAMAVVFVIGIEPKSIKSVIR